MDKRTSIEKFFVTTLRVVQAVIILVMTACVRAPAPQSADTVITPQVSPTPATAIGKTRLLPIHPSRDNDIRFEHISVEQGISQSTVYTILQDQQGFMWFGTEDGLNCYDGHTFTIYRHDPDNPNSLGNNTIWKLYQDKDGFIWIGTLNGGLDRLNHRTSEFTHYLHDPQNPDSLSAEDVFAIFQDRQNRLWIGTSQGLDRFDPESQKFIHYKHDPNDLNSLAPGIIYTIQQDSQGNLWIGASRGLARFDPETGIFTRYQNDAYDERSLSYNVVTSIAPDPAGGLWVGTASGLNYMTPDTGNFQRFSWSAYNPRGLNENNITALHLDSTGILWIGLRSRGLDRLDPTTQQFTHYRHDPLVPTSLSYDYIYSIYEDQSGLLWFGALDGGINKYDRLTHRFTNYTFDPKDPRSIGGTIVTDIHQGQADQVWIATLNGGLSRFDRKTSRFIRYSHDSDNPSSLGSDEVWSVYVDHENIVWAGNNNGLNRLDQRTGRFRHYRADSDNPESLSNDHIYVITEDQEGYLWLGTGQGLNRMDRKTEKVTRYLHDPNDPNSLSHDIIWSLYVDRQGKLWVGTNGGGLNLFNPQNGTFTRFQNDPEQPYSLNNDSVIMIMEDHTGTLWLGTYGGGISRFDPTSQTFTAYTKKDGLPNDVIYGILEDEQGFLWLSTNYGISRFDPQTVTFRNFTQEDGLPTNEYNLNGSFKANDGQMLFGSLSGLCTFYPEQVIDNPFPPPVVITAFSKLNQVVQKNLPANEHIQLAYRDNFISFDFAALDYTATSKNQYAYKLDGLDKDWIYTENRRHADYPNLKPGNYTFRVKGSNNNGVWNETGAAVHITIAPPFWSSWWFQGLAILLIAGSVIAAYRLRVKSIETHNRMLQSQVAARTRELASLNTIASVVSRSLKLKQILQDALEKTLEVLEIEAGGIYLLDGPALPEGTEEHLKLTVYQGIAEELLEAIDHLKVGEGFSGRVVQTCEPVIVLDLNTDPRLSRPQVKDQQFRTLASFPLVSRSRVLGALFVITRNQRKFTQQNIDLLTAIGGQIGVAIENARLFDSEQRRAEQLRIISEVSQHAVSILDSDRLIETITTDIQQTFGYDIVSLGLVEGDELIIKSSVGVMWRERGIPPLSIRISGGTEHPPEGVIGWVVSTGQSILVPDVTQDPRYLAWPKDIQTRSELAVPLKSTSGIIGVLNIESKYPNAFDQSDLVTLQALAGQITVAIENARFFASEQHRTEQFRVIAEIGHRLSLLSNLDETLVQMAQLIQQSFGYYHVGIGLIEANEVVYRIGAGDLWDNPQFTFKPARLKVGKEGASGWVASTGQPLMIPDVSQEPRYVWMRDSKTRSELIVPIIIKGQVGGVLDVQSDRLAAFDETDLSVLQALAHQAGAAIENSRLYTQALQLAVIDERSRLARELHDSVTQALYGVTLYAQAASGQLELANTERAAEHLHELQDTAQEALAEMRLLIHELRPSVLTDEGLVSALQTRLQAVEGRTGVKTDLKVQLSGRLPSKAEEVLYRIAQEALNNALKYAHARNIMVYLHQDERIVTLEITDDGVGFDPVSARQHGGLGLSAMEERVVELQGHLAIDSKPGQGTRLIVEVHL